ncbi:hypothetical protein AnigIFM59636_002415 [Aspergillus niger]|nr:hypothetical protein AnigIFM59636_002415 [Aspergillus niger]
MARKAEGRSHRNIGLTSTFRCEGGFTPVRRHWLARDVATLVFHAEKSYSNSGKLIRDLVQPQARAGSWRTSPIPQLHLESRNGTDAGPGKNLAGNLLR